MDIYGDIAQGLRPRASFSNQPNYQQPGQPNEASFTRTSVQGPGSLGYQVMGNEARKPMSTGMTSMPTAQVPQPPSNEGMHEVLGEAQANASSNPEGSRFGGWYDRNLEAASPGASRNLSQAQFGGVRPPAAPAGQGGSMIAAEHEAGL